MSAWMPTVRPGDAPLYERIADAIEEDVREGKLDAGFRLPPHRELAHRISVSIGTITKAYAEGERRGLLTGHVGRGSFVAAVRRPAVRPDDDKPLDLARNLPPTGSGDKHLSATLSRLRRRGDLASALGYAPPEGMEAILQAGAAWLTSRHGLSDVKAEDIVQCNGGQHALLLVLGSACRPGDAILCEASTFFGLKSLSEFSGYRLQGVGMDDDGVRPDAFEQAVLTSGARVFYTVPTLHNPTAVTTSARRREELVAIARRHDVLIVEDDAYRAVAGGSGLPATYADLAPERTVHIATLSKGMLPGLRLGFVKTPNQELRRDVIRSIRATSYSLPSLGGLVFSQWIEDGTAGRISDEVVAEAAARTRLAQDVLGEALAPIGAGQSLHVWLPLSPLEAERTAGRALRAGVELTPPDAPIVDASAPSGLRICLGGAPDLEALERGLKVVSTAIDSEIADQARTIV